MKINLNSKLYNDIIEEMNYIDPWMAEREAARQRTINATLQYRKKSWDQYFEDTDEFRDVRKIYDNNWRDDYDDYVEEE